MPSTCTGLFSGEADRQAGGLGCVLVTLGRPPAALPSLRGLLTEKAAPVMNIIHSIFSLVLKFRSQLISQNWGPATGPRGAEHPNFPLMQQSYSTFKYYSHFLFKVVTKLVNRGYQPHLEDFLLRINFNNYYQDS